MGMETATSNGTPDVERDVGEDVHLANRTVHSLAWEGIKVSLEHRFLSDLQPKTIICDVDGLANAGKLSGQISSPMSKWEQVIWWPSWALLAAGKQRR